MMKRIIGALLLVAAMAQAFIAPGALQQQQRQCLAAHRLSSRGRYNVYNHINLDQSAVV